MAKKTARKTTKRVAKKTTKKTTKKAPARKPAAASTAKKTRIVAAKEKPRTKSEVYGILAERADISRKQVAEIFDTMHEMMAADLKKNAVGAFTLPGVAKVVVQRKPATKARKGINPFTKEETIFKAKPARNVVKLRPVKALKDLVG